MKTESRRDGTIQLADWWEDLLWPRVLAAAALGLRPGRIGLAFFGMILVMGIAWVGGKIDGWMGFTTGVMPSLSATPDGGPTLLFNWFVGIPVACIKGWPATTVLGVFVILPMWLVVVGAISRMTAVEFARGEFITWTEALSFSLARMRSFVGAILGPVVIIWVIALILAAAGWLLLHWPWVNVLGGALYGIAIILGIAASLIGIAYIVGHGLLVPAVACEGSDAIDAIQRAYAYTLDRPVRLIVYTTLSCLGLVFVMVVASAIVGGGIGIAYLSAGTWAGPRGQEMILSGTSAAFPIPMFSGGAPETLEGSYARGAWLIRLWTMIPVYGLLACLVSCGMSCTTVVYLAIRRICDGQDTAELWVPGMIEGVMQESLKGRAQVAAAAGMPPSAADLPPDDDAAEEP